MPEFPRYCGLRFRTIFREHLIIGFQASPCSVLKLQLSTIPQTPTEYHPMARIPVHQWARDIGLPWLDVNTTASIQPKTNPIEQTNPSDPLQFGVEVGKGVVLISTTIGLPEHHAPGYPWAPAGTAKAPTFRVEYECTAEGDPEELPPGNDFKLPKPHRQVVTEVIDPPLSVDVVVYFWKEHPNDFPKESIPTEVMRKWMKQLNVLHIVVHTKVTLAETGSGSFSVEYKDESAPIPTITDGSTGSRTALLPPMEIILDPIGMPPPITTPNGLLRRAYFDVDSSDLNKIVKEPAGLPVHQANELDGFIKDMCSRWEVLAAFDAQKVPLKLEARASATYNGMSMQQLSRNNRPSGEAREYNQKLSEKRVRAVVDRMKQTTSGLHLGLSLSEGRNLIATAIGMFGAIKLGEEDPLERRCDITLDGAELVKFIKGALGRKPGGKS